MPQVTRSDPAPSKLRYRLQRMMLTPLYRGLLRFGLPVLLVAGTAGAWFADAGRRDAFAQTVADLRAMVEERPEFMVKLMAIHGASDSVGQDIREVLAIDYPISSFDLDLDQMRETIVGLDAVRGARLRIRQGGVLQVDVDERVPALLWRGADGLEMLDREGVRVGPVASRAERPDLPVIAGTGADRAVAEALDLYAVSGPLSDRMRGLERRGERRWDVVLDRDQRILLPETGAVRALERAIAMHEAVDMLARDLMVVDLRLAERPTLRMTQHAQEELWRIKAIEAGDKE
ncbi:cell division protein FtsQ/DivIB [Roseivivax sp. CAU 1761]